MVLVDEHAEEITEAKQKSNNLETMIEKVKIEESKFLERVGRTAGFFSRDIPDIPVDKPAPAKMRKNVNKKSEVRPPSVSGIMQVSDVHGNIRSIAIIEDRKYKVKEHVRGFKIAAITDKGVIFTQKGRRWLVRTPDIHFSINSQNMTTKSSVN